MEGVNMKKALLAALAAITFAGTAHAQQGVANRFVWDQVRFSTSAAANANGGRVDSSFASRVGAAGASSVLDTTVAISTAGWFIQGPGVVADSSVAMILLVYDATSAGDCESGAD